MVEGRRKRLLEPRKKRCPPPGTSYLYIEKLPLWVPLFVLTLGTSGLTRFFLHPFENNLLSTIFAIVICVALIASGLYLWRLEVHVDFDGVSETLRIREFRRGELHSEKKHPFQAFSGVRIKEERGGGKSRRTYYVIALSRGLEQFSLPGGKSCPEKLKARRDAIAKVLGLP